MKKFIILYQDLNLTEKCPIEKIKHLVGDDAAVESNFMSFNRGTLENHFKQLEKIEWSPENIAKIADGVIFVKSKEDTLRSIHKEYYDECKKQNTPIRIVNL